MCPPPSKQGKSGWRRSIANKSQNVCTNPSLRGKNKWENFRLMQRSCVGLTEARTTPMICACMVTLSLPLERSGLNTVPLSARPRFICRGTQLLLTGGRPQAAPADKYKTDTASGVRSEAVSVYILCGGGPSSRISWSAWARTLSSWLTSRTGAGSFFNRSKIRRARGRSMPAKGSSRR